jgi:hypothetical protein
MAKKALPDAYSARSPEEARRSDLLLKKRRNDMFRREKRIQKYTHLHRYGWQNQGQ